MQRLMPDGDCQHSGTYNAHPVVCAAALAALKVYREPGFYERIHKLATQLYDGMNRIFRDRGVPGLVKGLGARFGIYMGLESEAHSYRDAVRHNRPLMLKFIAAAIQNGVYFHDYGGGACHHGFCAAMTPHDIDGALERIDTAAKSL
jgi:glutamate-1-semialdehyde 2,1-aminomutase